MLLQFTNPPDLPITRFQPWHFQGGSQAHQGVETPLYLKLDSPQVQLTPLALADFHGKALDRNGCSYIEGSLIDDKLLLVQTYFHVQQRLPTTPPLFCLGTTRVYHGIRQRGSGLTFRGTFINQIGETRPSPDDTPNGVFTLEPYQNTDTNRATIKTLAHMLDANYILSSNLCRSTTRCLSIPTPVQRQ